MTIKCRGCGAAFGTPAAPHAHRLQVTLANGLILGGSFCLRCYGPLVTEVTEALGSAGQKLAA